MFSTLALAPFSALYGAAVRARMALYRRGVLKQERASAPVISVGNITTGGTGKTPLVEWVARAVSREGRVCVLTRGYGRQDERVRVVVSDGERLLADARTGGDEPLMLAEKLLGAASVVSCADRAGASRWAKENLGAEVFVLDDGFQHLRVARDLDIVTIDATSPWGGGHLLPRGRLRESPRGLSRADCIIITRADLAHDIGTLREEAARLSGNRAVILESRVRTTHIRGLQSSTEGELEQVSATQSLAAFCATGNPGAFFAQQRKDGRELRYTRAFPDHHEYTQADMDALTREARRAGAHVLLTTAKDAVKLRTLRASMPVYVVEIELEISEEDRLLRLLRDSIAKGGAA